MLFAPVKSPGGCDQGACLWSAHRHGGWESGLAVLVGERAVFFVRGADLVDRRGVELVFVVEDEPHVAEALETCLSESGFLVRSFSNGGQALKCAAEHAPDAVVCEAETPRMDGFSLGLEMRMCNPKCKVLLLTEGASAHDDFILLQKPVGLNALLDVLVDDLLAADKTKV
jgi:CheY-like chemotaxis protein